MEVVWSHYVKHVDQYTASNSSRSRILPNASKECRSTIEMRLASEESTHYSIPTYVVGLQLLQRVADGKVQRLLVISGIVSSFILAKGVRFVTAQPVMMRMLFS